VVTGGAYFLSCSVALAAPYIVHRWRTASFNAQPENYPGLGTAFLALAAEGGDFVIRDGRCEFANAEPRTLQVRDWRIEIGGIGLPPDNQSAKIQKEKDHAGQDLRGKNQGEQSGAESGSADNTAKIVWFGIQNFGIQNRDTKASCISEWSPFEGLDSAKLRKAAENRQTMADLIAAMLFTANFNGMMSAIVSLVLLMLVQNLIFVVVLGILLSFSNMQAGFALGHSATRLPQLRNEKTQSYFQFALLSIKIVICAAALPAFAIGILGCIVESINTMILWLAYTLLIAVRVIALYSARHKSSNTADASAGTVSSSPD